MTTRECLWPKGILFSLRKYNIITYNLNPKAKDRGGCDSNPYYESRCFKSLANGSAMRSQLNKFKIRPIFTYRHNNIDIQIQNAASEEVCMGFKQSLYSLLKSW